MEGEKSTAAANAEKVKVDPLIFWVAFGFIVAFVGYAIIFKDRAAESLQTGANGQVHASGVSALSIK